MRAKHIFSELHEQPFVVELDLRGTSSNGSLLVPNFVVMYMWIKMVMLSYILQMMDLIFRMFF